MVDGWRRHVALLALLLSIAPVWSAQVEEVSVGRDGARYTLTVSAQLSVSPQVAFATLTDYARLPDINPSVRRVRRVDAPSSPPLIHTEIRVCVLWLCKTMRQLQAMHASRDGEAWNLRAVVRPEHSNLRFGVANWRFESCAGAASCLVFDAAIEPDFWVPPIVGPWAIERTMRQQALATTQGIERVAAAAQ